jgi:hypothetical protein
MCKLVIIVVKTVTKREEILSSAVTKFFHSSVYTNPGKETDVAEIILE